MAYGLNTPESDIDNRFVFLNSDISQIIGLNRYDHLDIKSVTEDSFGFELRHFFNLLKRGNTQCFELLWNTHWMSITKEWQEIQKYKSVKKIHELMEVIDADMKECSAISIKGLDDVKKIKTLISKLNTNVTELKSKKVDDDLLRETTARVNKFEEFLKTKMKEVNDATEA